MSCPFGSYITREKLFIRDYLALEYCHPHYSEKGLGINLTLKLWIKQDVFQTLLLFVHSVSFLDVPPLSFSLSAQAQLEGSGGDPCPRENICQ